MANIRKTFNFRNGVQVDEDNLVVNSLGLVGIGTSVPTEALDVRGIAKIVGLVTSNQIFTNSLNVGLTTDGNLGVATVAGTLNVGIVTVGNLSIRPGIVTSTSGIVTYYGDGRFLQGLPTSQWVDVDVGLGFTSIYAAGYVGVATVDPRFAFQVGGNNVVGNFQNGVGINSTGDIIATGIISATTLRGNGALISSLNASNITSGTLDNARLPSNINISGIATFNGNVFVGSGYSVTAPEYYGPAREVSTVKYAYFGNTVEIENTGVGTGLRLTNGASLTITSGNANIGGILTATTSFLGVSSATSLQVSSVSLGVSGNSEIDTTSGNLTLDSAGGTVVIDDNLSVSGISTFTGEVRIDIGLIPDTSTGAYIGTSGRPFSAAYINDIEIGNVFPSRIRSLGGTLLLDSANNQVNIDPNLYVTGITTLNNTLNVTNSILPVSDLSANLGSSVKRFNQAYISAIQVGAALSNKINTINSVDLILDSATGTTFVDDNLKVSGLGTFSGLVISSQGFVPATDAVVSLGTSSLRFSEAHIDNIRIGVAQTNVIDTINSNLVLNSSTGITEITDDLYVTGIGSFTGEITSNIGFVPDNDLGAYIGTTGKRFSTIYTQNLDANEISVNNGSVIATNQSLSLTSNLQTVSIQDYLHVNNVIQQYSDVSSVGIGTTIPIGTFQIGVENDFVTTVVAIASTIGISTTIITGINTTNITLGLQILQIDGIISSGTTVVSVGSSQIGIGTTTLNSAEENDTNLVFGTGYSNNRIFIVTESKSVGIGTTNPTAKLDVRGDVRVGTSNSEGVILTSPDGTKYRLIVSNAGALSTVLVP